MSGDHDDICAWCGGLKVLGNPMGNCNHLYWPDNLTDEAKRANGYTAALVTVWSRQEPLGAELENAWDDNAEKLYTE